MPQAHSTTAHILVKGIPNKTVDVAGPPKKAKGGAQVNQERHSSERGDLP